MDPFNTTMPRALPAEVSGRNKPHTRLLMYKITVCCSKNGHGAWKSTRETTFLYRLQRPCSVPNGHQGPAHALLVWPGQRHVPWQRSGPNELISQLETLNGGTWSTWARLEEPEGERQRRRVASGWGAGYDEDEGVRAAEDNSPTK